MLFFVTFGSRLRTRSCTGSRVSATSAPKIAERARSCLSAQPRFWCFTEGRRLRSESFASTGARSNRFATERTNASDLGRLVFTCSVSAVSGAAARAAATASLM